MKNMFNQSPLERVTLFKQRLHSSVTDLLEKIYGFDMNTAEKMTENYFREGTLPNYYYYSNAPKEIADHVFSTTQLLNANTEFIKQESRDGKQITYLINVGRDFPGKLIRLLEENSLIEIASFDSVKTHSGIRIVSIEQYGRGPLPTTDEEKDVMTKIRADLKGTDHPWTARFLASLPSNYLKEEILESLGLIRQQSRIERHLRLFAKAMESEKMVVITETAEPDVDHLDQGRKEIRIGVAAKNPGRQCLMDILKILERRGINLHRSYLDTFVDPNRNDHVMIFSMYVLDENQDVEAAAEEIGKLPVSGDAAVIQEMVSLDRQLVGLVRAISEPGNTEKEKEENALAWVNLIRQNCDPEGGEEYKNFLLNAVSEYYRAAEFLGIADKFSLFGRLLRFESLNEFLVSSPKGEHRLNLPGFRFTHSTLRGAGKGGIRLDPIVKFDEVCALAFMMTFKTARSKILFGGAKGGMVIAPREFIDNRLDFADTLTNFGRSLFLVTGPAHDVPAGDVGCGAEEIGILFEGFKSALRDLALVAIGLKQGATVIGNRIVTLHEARDILQNHFDLDYRERGVLEELIYSEQYLNLIAAAQITGKPKMGIKVRAGATGRGLLYCVLAMISHLYLNGKWDAGEPLSAADISLLEEVAKINEQWILDRNGEELLPFESWCALDQKVFPKLLKNKKIVVQGTGNVGSSVIREFEKYGVNLVAVADVGGALIGDHLDVEEILHEVKSSRNRSAVTAKKGMTRVIEGAREGAAILELPCDILIPCALENVIDANVASRLQAKMIACGGNGTNTARAEEILHRRGIPVVYDFLANGGGVVASYFEWLRNLSDRYRYEAEVIQKKVFDIQVMDPYIMPEFKHRIKAILQETESDKTSEAWNGVLRDIMFAAVNDDAAFAASEGVSVKTAGFINATLRVLAADMAKTSPEERVALWDSLPDKTKKHLQRYLDHPEIALLNPDFRKDDLMSSESFSRS